MKDHHHTANAFDLDAAYCALARIGQRRGRLDPTVGTLDRALVETLTGLQELRRHFDREAVAAGFDSVCIRRDLRPASATRIAAAEAIQTQRAQDLAEQIERERRSAVYGRSGWAARGSRVLPTGDGVTGDGDRAAALDDGVPVGPSAATARTHAAPGDSHGHAEAETASPLIRHRLAAAFAGVECVAQLPHEARHRPEVTETREIVDRQRSPAVMDANGHRLDGKPHEFTETRRVECVVVQRAHAPTSILVSRAVLPHPDGGTILDRNRDEGRRHS